MTDRGRHARRSGIGFYRDVLFLVAGIVIVGALIFGGLSWWAGRNNGATPLTSTTTTATVPSGGSISTTSSSTSSTTTTTPSSTQTTTTTTPPATTLPESRDPAEVSVIVLNSIGVTGLAAELSEELAGLGYQMSEPDNYTPELSDTMIFHADGFALEALDLSEAVPDGAVAPNQELADAQGVDIVVVIGRSYQE